MKELVNKELTPAINNILFIYIYVLINKWYTWIGRHKTVLLANCMVIYMKNSKEFKKHYYN
jgi:hypothetical protein